MPGVLLLAPVGAPLVELPERLLAPGAAGPGMARLLGIAPGVVRVLLPVARSEPDLELVDLVPLGFGPLPLGYREKLLQALAGGNRLRIHDAIISHRGLP